ncbi:putative tryptophan transport protein [Compostibacillus humi]|uniref:Putative tryptophan transport protein n=1 Tax=Compostibacillus humi TaxID=1245525 RepID=A0A8J2ZS51_9BACI|nr:tryptophan transporter [Compostibacillus humi]GGH73234.1 putative tryptophan transport protein [Compostibacillus humi]
MNIRVLIILSLLVGIGTVLHAAIPGFTIAGVKPDLLLSMMFLGIFLFPKAKYVLLLSIVSGIIAALTTSAPGGQIANMIDKPVSAFVVLGLFLLLQNKLNNNINAPVLTFVGTFVSGTVFVAVLSVIASLPEGGFIALILTAVLPAAAVNTLIMVVVYPIVNAILKRMKPITV